MRLVALIIVYILLAGAYANASEAGHLTNVHRLSDTSMDVDNPSWSPDRQWIAASNIRIGQEGEADELWLFSTQGGKHRKLLGAEQLANWGSYGYSIWDITWLRNDQISFVISDNDVDSFEISLSLRSPGRLKESPRDPDPALNKKMPDELIGYLDRYYSKDSDQKTDLAENHHFFHFDQFGGKWYVHYLRDLELLVIDLPAKSLSKASLSLPADQIGDNLKFQKVGNKILAVYPVMQSSDHIADHITSGQKAVQLFRASGYPHFFYSPADSHVYVYTRSELEHPFRQVHLYRLSDKLESIPTQDWHNLAFSQDGKNIAVIKVEQNRRILYRGDFIGTPAKPSRPRRQH